MDFGDIDSDTTPAHRAFHAISSNTSKHSGPPEEQWPEEWKKIYFKTYPRFPRIYLEKSGQTELITLAGSLTHRRSRRQFSGGLPIDIKSIETLLSSIQPSPNSIASEVESLRPYPSAGARYPIELYLLTRSVKELPSSVHHYNFRYHALECLWPLTDDDIARAFPYQQFLTECSAIIVLTAFWGRSCIKYGERGYRYSLLEAGHIAQNISLASEAARLGSCPYGGFHDEELNRLLDLEPSEEAAVYSIILGPR